MKFLTLISLATALILSSCKLDPPSETYSNVVIPIDTRTVPQTGYVDEPLSIYAHASLPNGCWSNIRFFFQEKEEFVYELFSLADFASTGVCPEMQVTGDTLIVFEPKAEGDYVIVTWMTPSTNELDTISVELITP
ncbi:MAG: hypothetical protein RB288_00635 [Bacteroidales bacterium]|jgi:hypothetical protein|nr:hypothetical protein [Bacteroidales bacterium]